MSVMSSRLLLAATLVAATTAGGCNKLKDHKPGGLPDTSNVPTSMPGGSGEVDPNTCGNYAAIDAGIKLKAFLQATKDLDTELQEIVKVEKNSCITMGKSLQMNEADLAGDDTQAICGKVVAAYQDNLKVSMKAGAKLKITFKPAVCTVDASMKAHAAAECSGSASGTAVPAAAVGRRAASARRRPASRRRSTRSARRRSSSSTSTRRSSSMRPSSR